VDDPVGEEVLDIIDDYKVYECILNEILVLLSPLQTSSLFLLAQP
jgi:hypothetical protein